MQLPRNATQIGVVSVDDRETRRPVGRLAVIRHNLPLFSRFGMIGMKSPCTVQVSVLTGPETGSMFTVWPP